MQKNVLGNSETATNATKLGGKAANEYTTKDKFAVLTGSVALEANTSDNLATSTEKQTVKSINFPAGFNKDNCICIAFGMKKAVDRAYSYGIGGSASIRSLTGSLYRQAILGDVQDSSKIALQFWQLATQANTYYYKLVLMRID